MIQITWMSQNLSRKNVYIFIGIEKNKIDQQLKVNEKRSKWG